MLKGPLQADLLVQLEPTRRSLLKGLCPLAAVSAAVHLAGSGRPAQSLLETEDRIALALMRFREGFHCSQSVLAAYAEDFGIDEELALRLAAGLAGGSTVGGECGAVAAGYLVLSLRHGRLEPSFGDTSREEALFGRIRRFVAEFKEKYGSINCRELLGTDVCTPEGRQEALQAGLFLKRCPSYLRDAITILESLG